MMSIFSNKSKILNLNFLLSLFLVLFLSSSVGRLVAFEDASDDSDVEETSVIAGGVAGASLISSDVELGCIIEKIISTGDFGKLEKMLQENSDYSDQSCHVKATLLMHMVALGSPQALGMVRMLLATGITGSNLNATHTRSGNNLLVFACTSRGLQVDKIIELLLNSGMSVEPNDQFGHTMFMLAASSQNEKAPEIMRALINHGGANLKSMLNAKYVDGNTAIMYAARSLNRRASEIITMLLEAGAGVNVANLSSWTPLMFAAESQNVCAPEIVELLLAAGARASINQVNVNGWTALMLAANSESKQAVSIVAQLVRVSGINITVITKNGFTALFLAAMSRKINTDIITQLLEAGANPDAMVNNMVVLDFAIKSANLAMVTTLLAHNASPYGLSRQADRLIKDYQGDVYYAPENIGKVRHNIALAILNKRTELQASKPAAGEPKRKSETKTESAHKRSRRGGGDTGGTGGSGAGTV